MKKTLLLCGLAVLALAGSVYGQGQVSMINSATTAVTLPGGTTGVPTTFNVQLWAGPAGTAETALTLAGTGTFVAPGRYNGGAVTINGVAGGASAALQVRAWSGAATYAAAVTTQNAFWGKSAVWTQVTGGPAPNPPTAITGTPGVNAFTVTQNPIPEPSTIALGLLGLGAVALFRRRK